MSSTSNQADLSMPMAMAALLVQRALTLQPVAGQALARIIQENAQRDAEMRRLKERLTQLQEEQDQRQAQLKQVLQLLLPAEAATTLVRTLSHAGVGSI